MPILIYGGNTGRSEHVQQRPFETTIAGNALTNARAVKRIDRQKADKLLEQFLSRVRNVNARDELSHVVDEVWVFGSYADPKAIDFGDLDIAIDIKQREVPGRDVVEHALSRARASGRTFGSYFDELFYSEREVWGLLKARSPYISLHSMNDLKVAGATSKLIHKRS